MQNATAGILASKNQDLVLGRSAVGLLTYRLPLRLSGNVNQTDATYFGTTISLNIALTNANVDLRKYENIHELPLILSDRVLSLYSLSTPQISGGLYIGSILTCTTGEWSYLPPASYSYQWFYTEFPDYTEPYETAIVNATANTLLLTEELVDKYIFCKITIIDANLNTATVNSELVGPVYDSYAPTIVSAPIISGNAQVGYTLTCSNGVWDGDPEPTYTYQWYDGLDTFLNGANSNTLLLLATHFNTTMRCRVTATNSRGSVTNASNITPVIVTTPISISPPLLSGTARYDGTLNCSNGSWIGNTPITYAYQWFLEETLLEGQTSNVYNPQLADEGLKLRCRVTATNIYGDTIVYTDYSLPIVGLIERIPIILIQESVDSRVSEAKAPVNILVTLAKTTVDLRESRDKVPSAINGIPNSLTKATVDLRESIDRVPSAIPILLYK